MLNVEPPSKRDDSILLHISSGLISEISIFNNLIKHAYKKSPFLDIQESHDAQRRTQTIHNVEGIIFRNESVCNIM